MERRSICRAVEARAAFPAPLLSSRARGWRDIRVELYHFSHVDAVVTVDDHMIDMHVSGSVHVTQSRAGHSVVKHLRPGDITVTPRGEPKRICHAGDNMVIVVGLSPAYVVRVAREAGSQLDHEHRDLVDNFGTPDPLAVDIGKQMLAALELREPVAHWRIDELKARLARHLLSHYSAATRNARTEPCLPPRKLARAIEYIDAHLRDDLSLACLARTLAISPSHLSHAFCAATGMPPHRFVLHRRVERAKDLLRQTDLSITDIAHRIGCASHSHFSVLFHRATGQTPRDFRR